MQLAIVDFPDFAGREMLDLAPDREFDLVVGDEREVVAMRSQHRRAIIAVRRDHRPWQQGGEDDPDEIALVLGSGRGRMGRADRVQHGLDDGLERRQPLPRRRVGVAHVVVVEQGDRQRLAMRLELLLAADIFVPRVLAQRIDGAHQGLWIDRADMAKLSVEIHCSLLSTRCRQGIQCDRLSFSATVDVGGPQC